MMRLSQVHWVALCCNICPSSSELPLKIFSTLKAYRTSVHMPSPGLSSSTQLSLAVPHCHASDLNTKSKQGHLAQTHYILQCSHLYFCPSLLSRPQDKHLLSLTWIFFFSRLGFGWTLAFQCELAWGAAQGVGGFIVSSRCWSSQDGWVWMEFDT